jgi:hypothetical protein
MPRECAYCPAIATKKCASCGKASYCSQKCQRAHWKHHIFSCEPPRQINTAYKLCRAAFKNIFPEDEETLVDYGFNKTTDAREFQNLLGLYIGLFVHSNVDPKDVHRWRKNGILLQEIKRIYDAKTPSTRGGYYPWLLENQHILDPNSTFDPLELHEKKTWAHIGGDPNLPDADRVHTIKSWPEKKYQVWILYYSILSGFHPSPDQTSWVEFGFCTCRSELEESGLAFFYTDIIKSNGCPFDEFVAAHTNTNIPSLFPKYAAGPNNKWANNQHLCQLLEQDPIKSVWRLKAYVYQTMEQPEMLVSFRMDYGIINCQGVTTLLQLLKDTYKRVFEHQDGDPDKLHEAAMQGATFDYIDGLIKLKKKDRAVLRRLMKNRHST